VHCISTDICTQSKFTRNEKIILYTLLLCLSHEAFSQRTGTYDTTYSVSSSPFNNTNRKFSLKIRTDYSSSNSYPLVIGLHGMGEISTYNIADNGFLTDSINAILICPDGMDATQSRHDNQYSGNEVNIILEAVNFAKRNYNIDTNSIYIMGFSYGASARVSLYYGLNNKNLFRGIISVSTGYQSIADANNNLAMP
jgi:predicted peptidase